MADRKFWLFVLFFILFTTHYLLSTTPAQAQNPTEYQLLAPIPLNGPGETKTTTAGPYITGIFTLIIAIAGGLAVIKIIFGGIKYMSTDAFTDKNEAKDTIQNAIWGLVLAISAWLILYTVNPNLVKFDLTITPQQIATGSSVRAESTGGLGGTTLTQLEVENLFQGKIEVAGSPSLNGIRQSVVNELIRLKDECNCEVIVTSATGGEHDTRVQCNHRNGYKVDLRSRDRGKALTKYIFNNYQSLGGRSDGAQLFRSPATGAIYALEPSHWDVAVC